MIPSKLYIPTTTLNFNNIMASESISPAGFYPVRGFGYKRFDKVVSNNLEKRIILYEKFPEFKVDDKELEHYPLVIEIDTKTIGEDVIKEYKEGVFYSDETIYLNPFSTQIIFNTETEKRNTLSKTNQSLNTKMVVIYHNCIVVKSPTTESFKWKSIDLTDSKDDCSKHISKDRKINKLKGFLYAYLLGVNNSVSKNVVYAKKRTKDFQNELSALINCISAKEAETILNCLDVFVDDINSISDKTKIEIKDLPNLQHCSKVVSVHNNDFLPKLFNEYLEEVWSSEEFLHNRLDFATKGGKLFKEELQDKWDNSPSQKYINDLRNNLASHTAFILKSTDNLTLQSFGAFCQKGEEDIDKLEDYLISNEVGEFHIAYSLWGIVFGFANMPKTLTNKIFLSNDLNYITGIYKYIFKQIHNIDLVGNLEKRQEEKGFFSLPSKINEQPKNLKAEGSIQAQTNKIESEYRKKLHPLKLETLLDSIIEVCKEHYFNPTENMFTEISNIKGIGKNKLDKIKNALLSKQQKTFESKQTTLFASQPRKEFYLDDNAWSYIENLSYKNQEVKDKVKRNLKKIQKEYREDGYYNKRNDPNDNKNVIEHFLKYCTSEKNKYNKLEYIDFTDKIKTKIIEIFGMQYPSENE